MGAGVATAIVQDKQLRATQDPRKHLSPLSTTEYTAKEEKLLLWLLFEDSKNKNGAWDFGLLNQKQKMGLPLIFEFHSKKRKHLSSKVVFGFSISEATVW